MHKIHKSAISLSILVASALLAGDAYAKFIFNVSQSGLNVVITGSGTINTAALNVGSTGFDSPRVFPSQAIVVSGPTSSAPSTFYRGASGPQSIGSGLFSYDCFGSGDVVGTIEGGSIEVPAGYVSGTFLSDNAYIPNETLSYIGLTPGTYVDTWGSGATADSLTINVLVPEPVSVSLIGIPAILALRRRRRTLTK